MVHVLVHFELENGKLDAFVEAFSQVVPIVRAEQGCLQYDPMIDLTGTDLALPFTIHADSVTLLETWESLDALKSHLVADHMVAHRIRVKDMIRKTTVRLLQGIVGP